MTFTSFFLISFVTLLLTQVEAKEINQFRNEIDPLRNPVCFFFGYCTKSQIIVESNEKNEVDCLKLCKSSPGCAWFSYQYKSNLCQLLDNCIEVEITNFWISGSGSCRVPECWISGKCLGRVYYSGKTQTKNDCLALCKSYSECSWFTFSEEDSNCVLYLDCPSIDETCAKCVSGEHSCIMDDKPSGNKSS